MDPIVSLKEEKTSLEDFFDPLNTIGSLKLIKIAITNLIGPTKYVKQLVYPVSFQVFPAFATTFYGLSYQTGM